MLKRSKKILLEGTLAEFKNYPRGAEGREYVLMNIEEKKPDGSYALYEKDEKGDIIPVSYKGTEGYDAAEFILLQFVDPEFERVIFENFNTNPKGGITKKEYNKINSVGLLFKGNTALITTEDLGLFEYMSEIPSEAFESCTNLLTAVISSNITSLGNGCFDKCSNLKKLKVYGDASLPGSGYFGLVDLDSIEYYTETTRYFARAKAVFISNNVKTIGSRTFEGWPSLTLINISNSVTKIESFAFSTCTGLSSIELPSSISVIEGAAFYNCTGLTYIKCYREIPASIYNTYYGDPFYGIISTCTLYVPINSLEAYQTANYWKNFLHIVGFDPEEETQE